MNTRLSGILHGLKANLKFTNRLQLIYDRIFRRDLPLTHYIWKNRLFFVCNPQLGDHRSLQECLCDRAYDELPDKCHFTANQITYVNIGANIGVFDLLLVDRGLLIAEGLAVELNPLTYTRCLLNFQSNHLISTRLVNAGLAGEDGIIRLSPMAVLRKFRYIIIEFHAEPENESVQTAYAKLKQAGFSSVRIQPGKFLFTDLFTRNENSEVK